MTRRSTTWTLTLIAGLLLASGPSGCGDDSNGDDGTPLEIIGTFGDEWGSTYVITETLITLSGMGTPSEFHITSYDNANDFLIAQNGADNEYSPDLWSRFDWAWSESDLYLCQIAYDAATEAAALAASGADPADLTGAGCNGFAWSKLTTQ